MYAESKRTARGPLPEDDGPEYIFATFWEAWKVDKGATSPLEPFTHTDNPHSTAIERTCGQVHTFGIVRFFCESQFGNTTGVGNLKETWAPKDKSYGREPCIVKATDIVSVGPPGPDWWFSPAVEGPAFNSFGIEWTCCPCDKHVELYSWP